VGFDPRDQGVVMHLRDLRGDGEGKGRTNDSGSLDELICMAEILFSSQVCTFISSRDVHHHHLY
jgi:hypothetical protein